MFDEEKKQDEILAEETVEVKNEAVAPEEDTKEEKVDEVKEPEADACDGDDKVDAEKEVVEDDAAKADTDDTDKEATEEAVEKEECTDADKVENNNDDVSDTEEKEETEGKKDDDASVEEEKKDEIDIDKLKADYEELKAEREEEKALQQYFADKAKDDAELAGTSEAIAQALDKAFKDNGIDTTKTLEELRAEDANKAAKAEAMINEAMKVKAAVEAKQKEAQDAKLRDIVFTKAGRLFDKYNLNKDEAEVVCETFFNILENVGLVNLDDDLVAKVELAVGRAKLLCPRVADVVEEVKDIAAEAADIVTNLVTPTEEPEQTEDEKRVLEEIKKEDEKVDDVTPVIDIAEFTESATTGSKEMGDAINEDNVLEKMAAVPFKERTAFYKEHFALIDKACRKRRG